MVELQHREPAPPELLPYANAPVGDFDDVAFLPVKRAVKVALHAEQGGLCVYCEKLLSNTEGHVEHIRPKRGNYAHPHLCFVYGNLAHSCDNPHTCGHNKKSGILPIEPGPGCNSDFTLLTDGQLDAVVTLDRVRRHEVRKTRDMLGLNTASLCRERKQYVETVVQLLQQSPNEVEAFLAGAPFRSVLQRL